MIKRKGDWVQTYSGRQFWPLDPRPEEVCIEDIAHALANTCRFGGHCKRFYSVAEHSILISRAIPSELKEFRLQALMHDSPEAYFCDMPSPVKRCIPEIKSIENRLWHAICDRFDIQRRMAPIVKEYDARILLDEKEAVMLPALKDWELDTKPVLKEHGLSIQFYSPLTAKQIFLDHFKSLYKGP